MSFHVDTGFAPRTITGQVDDTQSIRIHTRQQAKRLYNRIREAIEAHEDQHDLEAYWGAEDLTIDALHLFDPTVAAELRDAYETHRAALTHGGVNRIVNDDPRRTDSGTAQTAQSGQDGNEKEWFDEL